MEDGGWRTEGKGMRVYNTLTRKLEEFVPIEDGHVRMYTCGPTVYDYAHIGNFRAYVFEDLLRRYLKYCGYRVMQVMNLTDVDDKTIGGTKEAGIPLNEYTSKYKKAFFDDLKTLNIEPAEYYPAATEHVPEMIELIQKLFDNGYAYKSDDGSVYFSISKFKHYGKLSHLDISRLRAGARVAQDEYEKENVADFALWKAWNERDGDVAWNSPWGRGRPGWHIECSAMSTKYLGPSFDLHTGGIDNIFPHHEDEIAQSEAASGRLFVRYWMHCEHLIVDGRKMSKSLGNFYTLRDVLARGYSGREIRYVLISAQYRQSLNFTFDALDAARAALMRLDDFRERLEEQVSGPAVGGINVRLAPLEAGCQVSGIRDQEAKDEAERKEELPKWAKEAHRGFKNALDDDLNMPEALGAMFEMTHAGNKSMDALELDSDSASCVINVLSDFDLVLGFLRKEDHEAGEEMIQLVEEREKARKARKWKESDMIRKRLAELGWEVRDTPEGPKLKKRSEIGGQRSAATEDCGPRQGQRVKSPGASC